MKSSGTAYNYERSFERLAEELDAVDGNYVERDDLPARDSLTFENGFYVKASALFVDIRKSSDLPGKYSVPKLAKLYRAFVSEIVAVLDGSPDCDEVSIVGDGVWGVFEGRTKAQVDSALEAAGKVSSLIDVFNERLQERDYDQLRVGIGLDWGRALVIKTGYYGSGINDVVYLGKVVNSAAKLCSHGEEEISLGNVRPRVMAGSEFVANLASEKYRSFFSYDVGVECYTASIVNEMMNNWRLTH